MTADWQALAASRPSLDQSVRDTLAQAPSGGEAPDHADLRNNWNAYTEKYEQLQRQLRGGVAGLSTARVNEVTRLIGSVRGIAERLELQIRTIQVSTGGVRSGRDHTRTGGEQSSDQPTGSRTRWETGATAGPTASPGTETIEPEEREQPASPPDP